MGCSCLILSLLSGFLASFAGVLGKMGMASEQASSMCQAIITDVFGTSKIEAFYMCESISSFLRGGLLLLMIACNALMWTIFTKALRSSSSTVEVTVVNLAANFFSSAVFGQTFFGERPSPVWYCGCVLIIMGLALMHAGNQRTELNRTLSREKHCDKKYPGTDKIYERHLARKSQ